MNRKGLDEIFPLPKPKTREFLPVVRVGREVPWGYKEDPEDSDILIPIQEELLYLEKAKKLLKQYSYKAVAYWLSEETGRTITAKGLWKRVERERSYRHKCRTYEFYAKRYKEAMEKAEKYSKRLGGKATYRDPEDKDL